MMATDKKSTKSTLPDSSPKSMILRLSRGRTLKVTFRPRIRIANILLKLLAAATGLFALSVAQVQAAPPVNALPAGGQVVYGNTSFQQAGSVLNVNQASQSTIINWQSFNIGAQSVVNFNQPNSSAVALNRILGDNASQIYGQLNANGHVFLLNPNGMLFAPGSQVNVGGLLASTMHMSDNDFIAGSYRLTGASTGFIDSQGNIGANSIAFVGNNISNSGNLYATNVSLVAGDTVAVDISGDGLIRGRVENPALQASISNSGNINAVQQVTMTAGQSRDTLNNLVNNSGIIRATGLSTEGGVITLQGGTTLNSGKLDASSATGKGGTIQVLGEHVGIVESGSVIASGATGGGTILVGGDFQGKNPDVFNADRTFVGANTTLNADAINTGNGGKVIVWANDITRAYGNISARGGAVSGNGGFVEVSGKHNLDYRAQTDTRAPNGQIGTLLLDPDNIVINAVGGDPLPATGIFFGDSPSATITVSSALINASTSSVILQALSNINFNAPINMTTLSAGLTVQAGQIINLDNSITTNGGIVDLTAGDPGGASPFGILRVNAAINTTGSGNAGANVLLTNVQSGGGALGGLQLNANITAGAGTVFLNNTGNPIVQSAVSGISASNLSVTSSTGVSLTGANNIANNLAASITGAGSSFTYNSNSTINVGSVGPVVGISTSNGNATLNSAGNLNVNESINLGTGDLSLTAVVGSVSIIANGPLTRNITARNITASALNEGNIIIGDAISGGVPNISVTGDITLLAEDSIAGGNIDISGNIAHTGATDGIFTINAENNIVLNNAAITSTGSQFAVTLASNVGVISPPNGTIALTNSSIDSNGGNITLGGGAGAAGYANSTISGDGINLNTSTLNAGGGNIALRGRSETSDGSAGVFALDSTITTIGAGTISIDGVGAPGATPGATARGGVAMSNTNVNAVSDITITGANTNAAASFSAVRLFGGTNISNSTGNINITGSSFISATADVAGIEVIDAIVQNTSTGDVNMTGTSTGTGSGNRGLLLNGPGSLIGVADGGLNLTGDASAASSGFNSDGILVNGGAIVQSTGAGQISLIGKSASGGIIQSGILLNGATTRIRSLGSGAITLNGEGNGTGTDSYGVLLFNSATITSTGSGVIDIFAKANNTTSAGLAVDDASVISTNSSTIIRAGNNNPSPTGDQIRFGPLASITGSASTSDSLTIEPINLADGIALGDNTNTLGTFSLNSTDLAAISNFTAVNIGAIGHTGTFNVAAGGLDSFSLANNNSAVYLFTSAINMDFLGATTFGVALSANNFAGDISLSGLTSVNGTIGVFANDNLTIKAGSVIQSVFITNLVANSDLDAGGSGGGDFINLAGAGALVSSPGNNWNVYSLDAAGNTYGGLLSGNQAVWGTTFTGFPPILGENRYLFAEIPTLIVTSTNTSKFYGQDGVPIVANAYSATGFVNAATFGNVFTQDTAANSITGTASSIGSGVGVGVGSYLITVDSLGSSTGYALATNPAGLLTVDPANLTVTPNSTLIKTYGQTVTFAGTEFTSSALQNGETIGSVTLNSAGAAATANVNAAASPYAIIAGAASGGTFNPANYSITYLPGGVINVTPAVINLTGGSTYNGTTAFDASVLSTFGLGAFGTFSTGIGTETLALNGVGSVTSANAGAAQTLSLGTLALFDVGTSLASNYTLAGGTGTITPANATVTANSNSVTYNGTNQSVSGFTTTGLFGSDTLAGLSAGGTGANAGTYATTFTGSNTNSNYNVTSFTNGSLVIGQANLTVTATGINRVFDGTTAANVNLASAGVILGDIINLAFASANFLDASVGTGKQIDVLGINISGADAGNYNLVNASAIALADITSNAPPPPPTTSINGKGESDRTKADVVEKTQDLELVLLPVKIKLPTEEEYIVSTGVTDGKELSCK